uniref:MOB kinase activator-like 2 n=1 Tax=Schistocephalus solidus TaxID=70667 RepID=A0A0X3NPG3_SCHSO
MEWLMGKARGVSRGLMSTTPTTNSPSEPVPPVSAALLQTVCRSNSPISDPTANSASGEATDMKSPLSGHKPPLPVPVNTSNATGVAKPSSVSASPLLDGSSVPRAPTTDLSLSEAASHHQKPFLRPCYLKQQLPLLTNKSKVATDFPALVEPLPTLDVNEWIAAHTIGLFENLSTIFDAIYELCTCDSLHASSWSDNENEEHQQVVGGIAEDSPPSDSNQSPPPPATITAKKSARGRAFKKPPQTARQAIIVALSECNDIIQSSRVFPIKKGQPFPSDLPSESAKICKKLLFCLSHLYMSHFRHLEQLDLIAHMNTLAKHFFAFTTRFNLIEDCDLGPLNGFHHTLLACPAPILNQKGSSIAAGNTVASTITTTSGETLLSSVPS